MQDQSNHPYICITHHCLQNCGALAGQAWNPISQQLQPAAATAQGEGRKLACQLARARLEHRKITATCPNCIDNQQRRCRTLVL
jgi:hypothetical protein